MIPLTQESMFGPALKASVASGMRAAGPADLRLASRPRPQAPDSKAEVQARVYRNDVRFKIPGARKGMGDYTPRGAIKGFSHGSRRRLEFMIRNTSDLWEGFVTLTYPADFPTNGREVKRHLNAFCSWLRREKVSYIWILEFQQRGAPHFHFLVRGWLDKTKVAHRWADIVGSWDRERHVKAGTRIEGVKNPDQVGAYMAAYMSKLEQKVVPKEFVSVGRFWGASRMLTSTLHRSKGLYRDAARAMKLARKWYGARNRTLTRPCMLPEDHAGPCRLRAEPGGVRCAKPVAAGFRWKWRGQGFVLIGGAKMFRALLRQAVAIDNGRDVWTDWDGERDKVDYLPPSFNGQLLLDGSHAPESAPDWDAPRTFDQAHRRRA